jgi:hypothetical protein
MNKHMPTRKIKDISKKEMCLDPEHNPPGMMVWEPGVWEHECPSCHKKQTFRIDPVY